MKDLTEKVVKFTRERDWDQFHSPENLAKSISIEAGVFNGIVNMI